MRVSAICGTGSSLHIPDFSVLMGQTLTCLAVQCSTDNGLIKVSLLPYPTLPFAQPLHIAK